MSKCKYFMRLESGAEDRESPVYGPFPEYLQLTYEDLTGLDGRILAQYNGLWYVNPEITGEADWAHATGWSDIVIWAEPA